MFFIPFKEKKRKKLEEKKEKLKGKKPQTWKIPFL